MIPIIRLTDLESGQPGAIDQLHGSLREYTFAHVDARRELGASFFTSLHQQTQEFFALPADEKAALDIGKSQHYRGYVGPGMEYTSGVPDLKESFEFGQELPEPAGERQSWFGLYGSNQWPPQQRLPGFRPVIDAYLNAMTRVAGTVLNSLMLTLGLPVTQERGLASGTLCCFARLIHYHHPSGYSSEGTRLARHTDSGMITIGLQNAPGLEVEVPSGDWLPVCPPPDVFTVFPGELAEAWARGY
jgi:isopenicillin N synthase-like dioxygenase